MSSYTKKTRQAVITVLATVIFLLLFSRSILAAHALPEFNATYAVQKFGVKLAEANYRLSHTNTGYKFTQNTQLYGFASLFRDDTVNVESHVDEVDGRLLLQKHNYTQTGREKNRDEAFSIQWTTSETTVNGKITGTVRSKKINLETDTPVWDVLSFQIPLMVEASENTKEYFYNAILKGEINTYNFVLTSSKTITFANKNYRILQLVRDDPEKDRQLHIWIAPQLNNLPLIVENYRDGKLHSRMQLEKVQFNKEIPLIDELADNDDDF